MFELSKLDPKALADAFQKVVEEQVGGAMDVSLHKYEQTNPGYSDNSVFISFHITEDILRFSRKNNDLGSDLANEQK